MLSKFINMVVNKIQNPNNILLINKPKVLKIMKRLYVSLGKSLGKTFMKWYINCWNCHYL